MFQEGIPPKMDDLVARAMLMEEGLKAFNDALKTVDQYSMKEINDANEWINWRGFEIKEIDGVVKKLLDKFSGLEERMHMLEEEGLVQEEMISSLQAKVDSLQSKICHCNEATSRPLSGEWDSQESFQA